MNLKSPPKAVGSVAVAARRTKDSVFIRKLMRSAIVTIFSPCSFAKISRSGIRAMVPSSFMISQITPLGLSPASRARSTEPSVWPVRTSTPPLRARIGKTCPGLTMSSGFTLSAMAVRIVVARSWAEMPVVTPRRASMETVKAVLKRDWLSLTMRWRLSLLASSSLRVRQMRPRPYLAMKLMASGVTNSAAMQRSPSFSRSSSSTRMTILPFLMSSIASGIVLTAMVRT